MPPQTEVESTFDQIEIEPFRKSVRSKRVLTSRACRASHSDGELSVVLDPAGESGITLP